jgi:hypothetical protein
MIRAQSTRRFTGTSPGFYTHRCIRTLRILSTVCSPVFQPINMTCMSGSRTSCLRVRRVRLSSQIALFYSSATYLSSTDTIVPCINNKYHIPCRFIDTQDIFFSGSSPRYYRRNTVPVAKAAHVAICDEGFSSALTLWILQKFQLCQLVASSVQQHTAWASTGREFPRPFDEFHGQPRPTAYSLSPPAMYEITISAASTGREFPRPFDEFHGQPRPTAYSLSPPAMYEITISALTPSFRPASSVLPWQLHVITISARPVKDGYAEQF